MVHHVEVRWLTACPALRAHRHGTVNISACIFSAGLLTHGLSYDGETSYMLRYNITQDAFADGSRECPNERAGDVGSRSRIPEAYIPVARGGFASH